IGVRNAAARAPARAGVDRAPEMVGERDPPARTSSLGKHFVNDRQGNHCVMTKTLPFPVPEPEEAPLPKGHDHLIAPHGGTLVDLLAAPERAAEIKAASRDWPSWDLTPRQFCDLELLLNGAFSPLTGFMGRADHDAVAKTMRLADGTLWPIPI